MPTSLIAIGSNLGERAEQLRGALLALATLPSTQVLRRSAWHETRPIGGPAGQGGFLNGAVLLETTLAPRQLLSELQRIEQELGRVRSERWAARSLDLDLLLYDALQIAEPDLIVPHPRMSYRRFVLEPAVEVAPGMVDPASGWTIQALLRQLESGSNVVAVAGKAEQARGLVAKLVERFGINGSPSDLPVDGKPRVIEWREWPYLAARQWPKLILAIEGEQPSTADRAAAGTHARHWRRMLDLPLGGPIGWLTAGDADEQLTLASAALLAVWPVLASP